MLITALQGWALSRGFMSTGLARMLGCRVRVLIFLGNLRCLNLDLEKIDWGFGLDYWSYGHFHIKWMYVKNKWKGHISIVVIQMHMYMLYIYIYVYFAVGKGDLQITIVSVAHYQTFPMCVDHSCILLQIFPL